MHRHAAGLAERHQARHDGVVVAVLLGQHLAVEVGRDAAHVVVHGRHDRDRLAGHVDAGEDARGFRNAGQALVQDRRIEMVEVQVDVVLELADAAAFADLDGHRARDHVARREVLGRRRVALHEALALGIGDIGAFAARAFGDQAAGAVDAGRVELHELHVLQRQAGAQHHGVAVAGADMRRGAGEIGAPVAAGGEDGHLGAEAVDRAVVERDRDHAAAAAFFHDQVDARNTRCRTRPSAAATGRTSCAAWRGRCGRRRRRCAARCPCRNAWSCRRTDAGRSCRLPRGARTAGPNARARTPLPARCGRDIRSRPGRRASRRP